MSVHVCMCFICVYDMFMHAQGIYMCMNHVHLGIAVYTV